MKKQANVGFIGAGGFISAHHLVTANESEYLNIAAIADLNEETLQRHAATKPVGYTTTDYKKLLADIRADAGWLVRMVENLLSVTRVDEQSVKLSKQDTVLEELVDAVTVKFRKHYPQQPVQVSIPEDFVSIPMDAMLTQQVLMNLLENAVFHAKGMKNLWLTVELRQDHALFRVADDGCGIPGERLDELFTGFRGSVPSDRGRSNMGIGLSVCSAIVKAHGGRIWARNREEGGAEFLFTLELEEGTHGEQ